MFVTLTVAPATAALVGSVTVPLMVPNNPCALVWCGHSTNRRSGNPANNEALFACFTAPSIKNVHRSGRRRFPKIGFQPTSAAVGQIPPGFSMGTRVSPGNYSAWRIHGQLLCGRKLCTCLLECQAETAER